MLRNLGELWVLWLCEPILSTRLDIYTTYNVAVRLTWDHYWVPEPENQAFHLAPSETIVGQVKKIRLNKESHLGYCVKLIFEDMCLVVEFYISVLFVSFVESMQIWIKSCNWSLIHPTSRLGGTISASTCLGRWWPYFWSPTQNGLNELCAEQKKNKVTNLVKLRIVPPNNGGSRLRSNVQY